MCLCRYRLHQFATDLDDLGTKWKLMSSRVATGYWIFDQTPPLAPLGTISALSQPISTILVSNESSWPAGSQTPIHFLIGHPQPPQAPVGTISANLQPILKILVPNESSWPGESEMPIHFFIRPPSPCRPLWGLFWPFHNWFKQYYFAANHTTKRSSAKTAKLPNHRTKL